MTSSLHILALQEQGIIPSDRARFRWPGLFGVMFTGSLLLCLASFDAMAQDTAVQTKFRIKHIAEGAVYLEGGRDAGLAEGQRLTVQREEPGDDGKESKGTAEIQIVSVASTSAVAEVVSTSMTLRIGDWAYLSAEDVEKLKILHVTKESRKYPQVITFTEGDPMDEEMREALPKPRLPEVNRIRGRIGLEYSSIREPGTDGMSSSQFGFVFRADITRIGGTHWNLSGYHRGRFTSQTPTGQQTLNDLINRTYHLNLYYNNPESRWVAGVGRFYLPWASSLDTIDGGYVGRHHGRFTFGAFAGTAPDPTSWNYAPNRQLGGGFFNIEGGNFESFRYTSTVGLALSRVNWRPDRQYLFWESSFSYKQRLSVYHDLEADLLLDTTPVVNPGGANGTTSATAFSDKGPVLSRDFLTVRFQPHRIITFDVTENYFRNIPTFDARLISTGLLDKVLFQGLSGGARLELPYRISPYVSIGKSNSGGDAKNSWNKMYGISWGNIWRTRVRADYRYSKFDSSFGSGTYQTLMLSRQLGESFQFDFQVGQQNFSSTFTDESRVRWITGTLDWFLGRHYFVGSGVTVYRGRVQNYDQWFINSGYRF